LSKAISELTLDEAIVGLLLPLLSEKEASVLLCKTPEGDENIPVPPEVPTDSTWLVPTGEDEFEFVASLMEVTLLGLKTSANGPPIDKSRDERDNLPIDVAETLLFVLALFSTVSALDQASMKVKPLGFSD
jgi:hypothetical protein